METSQVQNHSSNLNKLLLLFLLPQNTRFFLQAFRLPLPWPVLPEQALENHDSVHPWNAPIYTRVRKTYEEMLGFFS